MEIVFFLWFIHMCITWRGRAQTSSWFTNLYK